MSFIIIAAATKNNGNVRPKCLYNKVALQMYLLKLVETFIQSVSVEFDNKNLTSFINGQVSDNGCFILLGAKIKQWIIHEQLD